MSSYYYPTIPDPADFAWTNNTIFAMSVTAVWNGRPQNMQVKSTASAAGNLATLLRSVPSEGAKATAKIRTAWPGTAPSWMSGSLAIANSANGRIFTGLSMSDGFFKYFASRWNSITSQSLNVVNGAFWNREWLWHQIDYSDNTNIRLNVSLDGKSWITVYSEPIATFLGAITHVGFGFSNGSGGEARWQIEYFNVGSDDGS